MPNGFARILKILNSPPLGSKLGFENTRYRWRKKVIILVKFSKSWEIAHVFCKMNGISNSDPKIERLIENLTIQEEIVKFSKNTRYRWIRYRWGS